LLYIMSGAALIFLKLGKGVDVHRLDLFGRMKFCFLEVVVGSVEFLVLGTPRPATGKVIFLSFVSQTLSFSSVS